jgi:hypothetical protein
LKTSDGKEEWAARGVSLELYSDAAQKNLPFGNPAESKLCLSTPVALRPTLARGVPLSVEFQGRQLPELSNHSLLLAAAFVKGASSLTGSNKKSARSTPAIETIKQAIELCQSVFCRV